MSPQNLLSVLRDYTGISQELPGFQQVVDCEFGGHRAGRVIGWEEQISSPLFPRNTGLHSAGNNHFAG